MQINCYIFKIFEKYKYVIEFSSLNNWFIIKKQIIMSLKIKDNIKPTQNQNHEYLRMNEFQLKKLYRK